MNDEAKVRELFASSRARPVDVEGTQFKVDRGRSVDTILQAARTAAHAPARRSFPSVWVSGFAAAAALAIVGAALLARDRAPVASAVPPVLLREWHGEVARREAGRLVPFEPHAQAPALGSQSELVTAQASGGHLQTRAGLEIELFESSRLVLSGLGERASQGVELLAGGIRCQVPHLAAGEQFSVKTPEATIVVRGTAFSVLVSGIAEQARTCVRVEHGTVLVRSAGAEQAVSDGGSWGCATAVPALQSARASADAAEAAAMPAPASSLPGAKQKPKDRGGEAKAALGTLDEENRLFQEALAAERLGNGGSAVASLEQLLSRYPVSPLAAEARIALGRLKRKTIPKP